MIPLNYQTPEPPPLKGITLTVAVARYTAGLALGLVIFCVFFFVIDANPQVLVCCGCYSVAPVGIFWFVTFVRGLHRLAPLEERSSYLTFFSGTITVVIEYGISNWAENAPDPQGMYAIAAGGVVLPILCAFMSMRRR